MSAEPLIKTEILVVDDSQSVRSVIAKALGEYFTVHLANDGQQALDLLLNNDNISVIYTDMSMPVVNGLELLQMIRSSSNDNLAKTPVIVITGQTDNEATKKVVYDMGATDFILKPFDSIELLSKTKSYAELSQKINKLKSNSRHDELTNLYNQQSFNERGQETLAFAIRHKIEFSVAIADITNFDAINEKHSMEIADKVMLKVAECITQVFRKEDITARISGTRFGVIMPMTNYTKSRIAVDRLYTAINKLVFEIGDEKFKLNLAAGIATAGVDENLSCFQLVTQEAEQSLQRGLDKNIDPAVCGTASGSGAYVRSGRIVNCELWDAFTHILNYDYSNITINQLSELTTPLRDFSNYLTENKLEAS